jgi:FMN phosphatase YigB (HAD superfamily)
VIKSVIFDLSEVLIPGLIGIEKRLAVITGIPSDSIAKSLGSHPYHEPENNLEKLLKGEVSYEDYRFEIMKTLGLPNKYAAVFDSECLKMFDTPYAHTNEMIERVAAACDLYLLSDHCDIWASYIQQRHDFLRLFKGTLWSYEVNATKKSKAPFEALIKAYSLCPTQCLFVDDNHFNISIAISMGFNTVHFLGESSVTEVYRTIDNSQ